MNTFIIILQLLILVAYGICILFWKSYFPKYLEEKGKNLATKEDIGAITHEVESVKAEILKSLSIDQTKYQLKYESCLEALSLIDAHFSHSLQPAKGQSISRQFATTKVARACHSKLILSCENTNLLEKFDEIMFGSHPGQVSAKSPTDLLNEFRNLIRRELGFGSELQLNRERAWFGKINCEKPEGEQSA